MKVTLSANGTFLVDKDTNQYIKVLVEFRDLDPDQPLEPQLQQGEVTVEKAWGSVTSALLTSVRKIVGTMGEGVKK